MLTPSKNSRSFGHGSFSADRTGRVCAPGPILAVYFALLWAGPGACTSDGYEGGGDDDDAGLEEDTGTPEADCSWCADGFNTVQECICDPGGEAIPTGERVCAGVNGPTNEEAGDCLDFCDQHFGSNTSGWKKITCKEDSMSGTCSGWNPSAYIALDNGVYDVDEEFIRSLASSSGPLSVCDDAYIDGLSGPGFRVLAASSGDTLYELGLRNEDIPMAINGLPLASYDDAMEAFFDLYVNGGETEYTLVILRGTSPLTFYYELL
jgi:hypothetical protein